MARKQSKGSNPIKARIKRHASGSRLKTAPPRTPEQFFAKPEQFQDTWVNVTGVLAKMRSGGLSLSQAAKEAGVSPRAVTRLAASALKKGANGRYKVKPNDRLFRVLKVPTPDGSREIGIRGSKQATLLGEYWAAVHKYLATGDPSGLGKFRGKQIKDSAGKLIPLLTDKTELDRLGSAGVLSFESLYARSS